MMILALVLACGGGDEKSSAPMGDTARVVEDIDTGGFCATSPVFTYNNFGQGFLIENCNTCHAADAPYRETADAAEVPPASMTFDTRAEALAAREIILAMSTGDNPLMPPEGGVDAVNRERLTIWLTCEEDE